jgi:hypothetical protein
MLSASQCAALLPNVSGGWVTLASGREAVAIARLEQEAGASYRVIGRDGVERNFAGIADWIAAIRSGEIDNGCLFFDVQALRWRPLPTLEIYIQAEEAITTGASGSTAVDSRNSRAARGRYAVVSGLVALVLLALAAWGAGGQVDVQSFVQRVPRPALFGGAGVAVVLLGEEFYWLALRLTGLGDTRAGARFGVQALSLSTTALSAYAGIGISKADLDTPISFLVSNALPIGVGYAVVAFLWSIPLVRLSRASPAKKALASILASAMLFGTLYMAFAPSARHSAATDLSTPQERR